MNKIKVLELFGGIGAPRMALQNLGIKTKHIDYVEILPHAVRAYNRMFNNDYDTQSVKGWNINVDILIHGSPCQDFSIAGKNLGGDINSDTRSSLMWETVDIIKTKFVNKPKVIIWENVKGVLNKNHKPIFDKYLYELEQIGYTNTYEVLNSKDFGIPQSRNRVFVISILKDSGYSFDFNNLKKIPLTKTLKDILEPTKEVDEWYYIKQPSMIRAIERNKIKIIDNIAQTVTTKQLRWNNAGVVKIPFTTFNQENYVRHIKSIASTITATGANARQKVAIPYDKTYKNIPVFKIDGKEYMLRILTEKECWRLMGFRDETYERVIKNEPPITRSQMYFLAGNSIVVQVLEAIFKELFNLKEKNETN